MRDDSGDVELIEDPRFSKLLSGAGISNLGQETHLFTGGIGQPQFTNMAQASQIPSGGVMLIASVRFQAWFESLASTEYTVAYGTIAAETHPTSSPARALMCYQALANGFQATLNINDKPYGVLPVWTFPAGGGISGYSQVSGSNVVTNGHPGKESIHRLVKPAKVSSLQAFKMIVKAYTFASNTGSDAGKFAATAQGGAMTDWNPLLHINQFDGVKDVTGLFGGHVSRDK